MFARQKAWPNTGMCASEGLAWWGDPAANQLTPAAPLPTTSGDEAALPPAKPGKRSVTTIRSSRMMRPRSDIYY